MWAVFRKEMKSYFLSPIGYVVVGILLLTCSIFFYATTISVNSTNLGGLYFYAALYGLMISVPILTMRMFAEERKNGTEQLILTAPVGIAKVVLGKFLAALGVIVVTILISFIYYGIMCFYSVPNLLQLLMMMLGFVLVSGAGIAFGMFASSITENQIIAGIITIAYFILSIFLPELGKEFPDISIMNFYQKFQVGVVSLTEVVGAVTFTAMFIAFTIIVMQRRKLVK